MAIDSLLTTEIIEKLENFLESIRPPVEIRNELDMSYRIENQSVFLYEIRPRFDLRTAYMKSDFAKATYIKSKNYWKIYWMRANLKWYSYDPKPIAKDIGDFLKTVEEDKYGCFFG